ncbi:MAG: (2Fe-2S)-binding protein [Acidobacteria bacterium]|nr:(2Fe-2S)-binding protein [Acidobacteriota bacterium]
MSNEENGNNISRRKFIKGVGVGIAGSCVLPSLEQSAIAQAKEGGDAVHGGKELLSLTVNGKPVRVLVEPRMTLAELLREKLQLTGTKIVCNQGACGGCTVLLDGHAVYSCHMLALDAAEREVTTIEGLMTGEELHPIQQAFVDKDGYQCGFCTPGQVMAAQALLLRHPRPTREQVLEGMSGNICRCAAYPKILESALAAAEKIRKS